MARSRRVLSPRRYRLFIWLLASLFSVLVFWFLGFVVDDIGNIRGPELRAVRAEFVDAATEKRLRDLEAERERLRLQIEGRREVLRILRDSMEESRATMDQLVQLHRLNLDRNVTPTPEEQAALAESEQLFLSKQREFQAKNEEVAQLTEQLKVLEADIVATQRSIAEATKEADSEYRTRLRRHRLRIAAIKLAVLLPIFFLTAWFVWKWQKTAYAPVFYALSVAAFVRVWFVIHAYFPALWFKYLAVAAGIVVVLFFLVQAIRLAFAPKPDWLLKRYREAYAQHRCPICDEPIRRGPLRYAVWTRRGVQVPPLREAPSNEEPYTCPACGTSLFAPCATCGAIRHVLLPHCAHCGAETPILSDSEAIGQSSS